MKQIAKSAQAMDAETSSTPRSGKPRLLVLNVDISGMNRFLFAALAAAWDLEVVDVPFPRLWALWGKARTMHPRLPSWKRRYDRYWEWATKSARMFRWRARWCERGLRRRRGTYDIVLQISGLFAPSRVPAPCLYAVLASYTLRLAEREYSAWAPFRSPRESAAWYALERELYHGAVQVLTTNEHARRSVLSDYGVSPHRVVTVGYGIPLDRLPEALAASDGRTILFVGKDFERKGGFVLLDAFAHVRARRPDARLVVAGPNPGRIGRRDPGVEWLGQIRERERLADLYRQAHVFAMPSLCDPFGLVFLEAMAHGLPCVGTTVDAMPEIIDEGHTGFLVPPGDVEALADRLQTLLDDPGLARAMGRRGRERALATFSWEGMARRITEALLPVLERSRQAAGACRFGRRTHGAASGQAQGISSFEREVLQ